MLQAKNRTPFAAAVNVITGLDGNETAIAVAKATFSHDGDRVTLAGEQLPVVTSDDYYGDPAATSIRYASEVSLPKPGTDIVLIGHAYAPDGKRATRVIAGLSVGPVSKTVAVFGDRFWDSILGIPNISNPAPFQTMPLKYEFAYGGTDSHINDPKRIETFPQNPVGCGFRMKNGRNAESGQQLPNLEDPKNLISSPSNRPGMLQLHPCRVASPLLLCRHL